MTRRTGKSRVTTAESPVDGQTRRRRHGDHFHDERWCAVHQQWEPLD